MSPRGRLLAGAVFGLAAAIVVIGAANATWRTVDTRGVSVSVEGSTVHLEQPRALKGTEQDGSLALFAIIGGVASVLVLLLEPKPRMIAAAFIGVSGLMVSANAAITSSRVIVPDGWLAAGSDHFTYSSPTVAPMIAIAGGIGMLAAAAWLLGPARAAPRFSMPDGPPEASDRDQGAWE